MAAIAKDINPKDFYDAIVRFDESDEAQEFYYQVMDLPTGRTNSDGSEETVRDRILKAYAVLFCEEANLEPGAKAGVDEVADTADRLYIGGAGYDPQHWYRMKYHFPVIDDDNYDRFAALVLSDMNAGPLHDAALNDGDTLVVGEADPLHMTKEQRENQKVKSVSFEGGAK
ncbi:hypothetical protein [Butyrivibrio sp. VCD2006]|uniref:hypothetical protein n=1 Tax=Butyrivibrio sp. VCD2006 TaxID=1280664 RepID=UPI0003F71D52|nr:hypothetical protein [Butyrivibrio sp. VCD2006]